MESPFLGWVHKIKGSLRSLGMFLWWLLLPTVPNSSNHCWNRVHSEFGGNPPAIQQQSMYLKTRSECCPLWWHWRIIFIGNHSINLKWITFFVVWEGWIIANFTVPSTAPCDSSCPNLKSTKCLVLRHIVRGFFWLFFSLWSKEKYTCFQSTVYLTYLRCPLLTEMNQTPVSINHPDCQSSVASNRNTSELLWCWYSLTRWS